MIRRLSLTAIIAVCMAMPAYAGGGATTTLNADEAMAQLKEGNQRFVSGQSKNPNTNAERIEQTGKHGQAPFVTVITCSDSRVPVERLFDQGVGDVFVIRVAGNVCGVHEAGSIEYGLHHLNTPLLVVLGHTHCGAVSAVVQGAEVHDNIPALVSGIKPAVESARKENPGASGEKLIAAAVTANVWQSIEDLLRISPQTREKAAQGKTKIVGAIYDIETGKVEWLGEHPRLAELVRGQREHYSSKVESHGNH